MSQGPWVSGAGGWCGSSLSLNDGCALPRSAYYLLGREAVRAIVATAIGDQGMVRM